MTQVKYKYKEASCNFVTFLKYFQTENGTQMLCLQFVRVAVVPVSLCGRKTKTSATCGFGKLHPQNISSYFSWLSFVLVCSHASVLSKQDQTQPTGGDNTVGFHCRYFFVPALDHTQGTEHVFRRVHLHCLLQTMPRMFRFYYTFI